MASCEMGNIHAAVAIVMRRMSQETKIIFARTQAHRIWRNPSKRGIVRAHT